MSSPFKDRLKVRLEVVEGHSGSQLEISLALSLEVAVMRSALAIVEAIENLGTEKKEGL